MKFPLFAAILLLGSAAFGQFPESPLSPQPQVDQMQQAIQQQAQQLQQQQAVRAQEIGQQTLQLQMQRQTEQMVQDRLGSISPTVEVGSTGINGLTGRWWYRVPLVKRLGLTPDQQQKMDAAYQRGRLIAIDLNAALQREQTLLEPMTAADHPDEARIDAQIDKVGKARVELEKAGAKMAIEIRQVLTTEQLAQLKTTGE